MADRPLIAGVHVGPLVAVHLDADEVLVEVVRERGVFVRLAVHHVAPVAPDGADIEQHRTVGRARRREGRFSPLLPPDRLVRRGAEVG
jgi:hypothetical protein